MSDQKIRLAPINDGREENCQCARCGSSCDFRECDACAAMGITDDEYGWPDSEQLCAVCMGERGWWECLSEREWCEANPNDGRESVERGAIEWFDVPSRRES